MKNGRRLTVRPGSPFFLLPSSFFHLEFNFAQLTYGDRDYHIPPDWFEK